MAENDQETDKETVADPFCTITVMFSPVTSKKLEMAQSVIEDAVRKLRLALSVFDQSDVIICYRLPN